MRQRLKGCRAALHLLQTGRGEPEADHAAVDQQRIKNTDHERGKEHRSRTRSSRIFHLLTQRRRRLKASEGEDRIHKTIDNPREPKEALRRIERLRAQTVRTAVDEDDHRDEPINDDLERDKGKTET